MVKRIVEITSTVRVEVEVDEAKFTPEFIAEFESYMFSAPTLNDHVENLASLYARGVVDRLDTFIEGYGAPGDMGIRFSGETFMDGRDMTVTVLEPEPA